jgi:hypothetical protein
MKFGLFLTLAASVVSAFHVEQIDDAKIEDAYKPCGCNRVQCSAALSDVAARLIIQDFCGAMTSKSLVALQGGFATCDATFTVKYFNPDIGPNGFCISPGPQPMFTQILRGVHVNCISMTVDSVHVTAKGQVIAYSTLLSNWDSSPNQTTSSMRWVFNPDPDCPCKFYVSELTLTSPQCE